MNRWKLSTTWAFVFGIGLSLAVAAPQKSDAKGEKDGAALPHCPVMDEPVNFLVSTKTDDGPVYFCCKGCIDKYNKNAGKYAKAVTKQRAALKKLDKVQVTCPVNGNPADTKISVNHDGGKVHFCSKGCADTFKADPAKYKVALANSYTYQTLCPVMGNKINPKSFTKLPTGDTIYYCCQGCERILDDPGKYNDKLLAQGINVDWKKVKSMAAKANKHKGHDHDGHDGHDH